MKMKVLVVGCICCMILAMGLLAGCADPEKSAAVDADIPEGYEASSGNARELAAEGKDGEQEALRSTAKAFLDAYFSGDIGGIKSHLTSPYSWDIDSYSGDAAAVCNMTLKGLDAAGDKEIGDRCTLSFEFKTGSASDTFTYLTMEFVKEADGWKVGFYGLEG